MLVRVLLALVAVVLVVSPQVGAVAPFMVSYQGRLTDASGVPVSDGNYSVVFQIYDDAIAGTSLWSSGAVNVTTADGIFNVLLGEPPQPPVLQDVFATPLLTDAYRFLGITVGADPEILPRTRLTGTPRVATIDGATGGDVFGDVFLYGLVTDLSFPPNQDEDMTVNLVPGAINSTEMLNEPGFAQGYTASQGLGLPNWQNIASVSISTLWPGYIVVQADGEAEVSNSAGATSKVAIGITETGSTPPTNGESYLGTSICPNTGSYFYHLSNSATLFKAAGTYTFYLVGKRETVFSVANFNDVRMRAYYFPTSYGSVTVPIAPSEAAQFESTERLESVDGGDGATVADLRELELRAERAHREALQAELALIKSRAQAARSNSVGITSGVAK